MEKILIRINDGQPLEDDIVNKYHLRTLCSLNDSGSFISKFVGIIVIKNILIVSCPKHFEYVNDDDIELIGLCMMKVANCYGFDSNNPVESNMPYNHYLYILDYYQRFGLYKEFKTIYQNRYSGNIDWRKTSRESQKIISGDNLVFLPFITKKSVQTDTFIGECMKFILYDAYNQFGKYFGYEAIIEDNILDINDDNIENVLLKLYDERNSHFKDSEIQLIDAIIGYIQWKADVSDNIYLVTKSFELVWETMVNQYLTYNYNDYDDKLNIIKFKDGCKKYRFYKKSEYIQSEFKIKENGVKYSVEYDHYNMENNNIILFDSKYYNEIKDVNYKQIVYQYLLSNRASTFEKPNKIINGLIIPYEGSYYSKIHIDRSDIDGVCIVEHYLNLKNVMKAFV